MADRTSEFQDYVAASLQAVGDQVGWQDSKAREDCCKKPMMFEMELVQNPSCMLLLEQELARQHKAQAILRPIARPSPFHSVATSVVSKLVGRCSISMLSSRSCVVGTGLSKRAAAP